MQLDATLASAGATRPARRRQALKTLTRRPDFPPLAFLLLLVIVLSVATPGFASLANLRGVAEQVAVVSIVALAVNQVVLAGEIDVSTGSLTAACAFVYGNVALQTGGVVLPLCGAVGLGAAAGLFNGAISTFGRVPSIITTVGMLFILRGLVLLAAGAQVLNLDPGMRLLGQGSLLGVPISVVVLILLLAGVEIVSRNTLTGRNILAIGGNPRAAAAIGLPVRRARLLTFVLSGASCGLASAVLLGQIGQLQATAATGLELKVIAAVVLGGTAITGGRGTNLGPVVGALLVGIILNALTLNRVPGTFELLVLGALILAAISFDGLRRKLSGGSRLS